MLALILVTPITLAAGALLVRRTADRADAPRLVWLGMPLALLSVIAPVPFVTFTFMSWLQAVGEGGTSQTVDGVRGTGRAGGAPRAARAGVPVCCAHRCRLVALIAQAAVIARILRHLGEPIEIPRARPARAPPEDRRFAECAEH